METGRQKMEREYKKKMLISMIPSPDMLALVPFLPPFLIIIIKKNKKL